MSEELTKDKLSEDSGELQRLLIKSERPKSGLAAVNFRNLQSTRTDIYLTIVATMMTFGDAVEIYLPGVITQSASSELGVSRTEEGILAIILYVCLALSFFILPAIKNKVGRKQALLTSLYTSVIATVFCCLVPNYWTLVLSRALLGLCIGLNMSISGVYFAEEVSSYGVYNVGQMLGLMTFGLGAGWVAILGYFILSKIGWRFFILCTSVPIFIPPIFIFHFILRKTPKEESKADQTSKTEETVIKVKGFWGRLIKGCITNFINTFQGWGSILLIPALLTSLHKEEGNLTEEQELLILALLYGGAKLLGRILSIFLLKYVPFRILQPFLSVVIASCYLALVIMNNINNVMTTVLTMGIANMCFCVTRCELTLMEFDRYYFGTERLVLAAGLMSGFAMLGAAVGATTAQFLSCPQAVIVTFALSCVQVVTFRCITGR